MVSNIAIKRLEQKFKWFQLFKDPTPIILFNIIFSFAHTLIELLVFHSIFWKHSKLIVCLHTVK